MHDHIDINKMDVVATLLYDNKDVTNCLYIRWLGVVR